MIAGSAEAEQTTPPARGSCMERLRRRWQAAGTLLCIGLDSEHDKLPPSVRTGHTGVLSLDTHSRESQIEGALVTFNKAIVDATADLVCAFKPNSAFYEAQGLPGIRALIRTIAYIRASHPDVPVILDAKRGDIGSTSAAYARAAFEVFGADAITLQPYLGVEALQPFLDYTERAMFILCRTSNAGAGEFQDLRLHAPRQPEADASTPTAEEPLYIAMARRVAGPWNTYGNCGLVVGATYPDELRAVRAVAGDLPILVPGVGAQGGDLEAVLRAGLNSKRQGLVISVSRSVLYASSGLDFAITARHEAMRLRDEIERLRSA